MVTGLTKVLVTASIVIALLTAACSPQAPTAPAKPAATTVPTAATTAGGAPKPTAPAAISPVAAKSPASSSGASSIPKTQATFKPAPADLVAAARREGRVRFTSALEPREVVDLIAAFKAAYPGIEVTYSRTGVGDDERILLARQAGIHEYDLLSVTNEVYSSYVEANALEAFPWTQTFGTEPQIVKPDNTLVAVGNQLAGIAYNTNLVPPNQVPSTWDSCADPAFAGKKLFDVRPAPFIANWAYWGEQRTLDYARRTLPGATFVRGNTAAYTMRAAGEMSIYCGGNFGPFTRFKQGAPQAPLEMAFPDGPLLGQPALEFGVLTGTSNTNAANLLLGWMSTEGLPYFTATGRDSFFHPDSNLAQLAQKMGRDVIVYDWDAWERGGDIQERILKEWNFPTAR